MRTIATIFLLSMLIISNQSHASEHCVEIDSLPRNTEENLDKIQTKEALEDFIQKNLNENHEEQEPINITYLINHISPNLITSYYDHNPSQKDLLDKIWKFIKKNDPASWELAVKSTVCQITTHAEVPQYTLHPKVATAVIMKAMNEVKKLDHLERMAAIDDQQAATMQNLTDQYSKEIGTRKEIGRPEGRIQLTGQLESIRCCCNI